MSEQIRRNLMGGPDPAAGKGKRVDGSLTDADLPDPPSSPVSEAGSPPPPPTAPGDERSVQDILRDERQTQRQAPAKGTGAEL